MASTSYGPSPSEYELVPMSDEKNDTQQRTDNESDEETSLEFPQKPQTDEDKRTSEEMEIRYADESDPDDDDLTDKIERTQEEKDKRQDDTLSEDQKVDQSNAQKTRPMDKSERTPEEKEKRYGDESDSDEEDPLIKIKADNIERTLDEKEMSFYRYRDDSDSDDDGPLIKTKKGKQKWIQENIKLRNARDEEPSIPCNAFGWITFKESGKFAAFVRVDHQTSMKTMIQLIKRLWYLSLPKLLISVTGGRKDVRLNSFTKEALGFGLVEAARTTDAWIISEGLHSGVSKCIGEAIHDNEGISADGNKVVTIGIAPWNCVQNKESLVNKKGSWHAKYDIKDGPVSRYALDPNHSHFILVDNGTKDTSGVEIEFRRMFEDTITEMNIPGTTFKIPSVVVMVGGGPETLKSVCDSISHNIPVIIVKGSGGAADIMVSAYQTVIENEDEKDKNKTDWKLKNNIKEKFSEEFWKYLEKDDRNYLADVLDSMRQLKCITVFAKHSAEDFGVAIMKAVFKAKDSNLEIMNLGLKWKSIDIVKREIFTEGTHLHAAEMKWIQEIIKLRKTKDEKASIPCDAFGEVKFIGYGQKKATFVRVDHKTLMENMICFIIYLWDLSLPNLLISVIGKRENFQLNLRTKDVLGFGLVKAARTTGAWIISEGLHSGVSQYIGEAIHDNDGMLEDDTKVVTIGIAPWNCVHDNTSLVNAEGSWPADYNVTDDANTGIYSLDPNHSHFILVDNGTHDTFGVETVFRKQLEDTILQEKVRGTTFKIPSVVVMVGGGPDTLKSVCDSISRNIPVIIVKRSGGAADIMVYAYQTVYGIVDEDGDITDGLIQNKLGDIKEKITEEFGKDLETDKISHLVDCVSTSLKQPNLLRLYDIDSAEDFDISIMKALFKAKNKCKHGKPTGQWKRIDDALNKIFTEGTPWPIHQLDTFMLSAVCNDRVDLIKLFQEHGVNMTEFITERHINILYSMENRNVISNLNCKQFLDEFLPKIHLKKADLPSATQLFLWALFLDRKEMAFLFWKDGMGALPSALVANRLLQSMKEKCKEYGRRQQLEEHAELYDKRATGVLDECYYADDKKTLDLLMLKQKTWENTSYMQMANNVDNKEFMSKEACQSVLTKIWMGEMSKKNNIWKLLLCTLCPLFIFLIEFDDEKDNYKRNNKSCYKLVGKCCNPRENCNKLWGKCRNMFSRCPSFYKTPVIKFLTNLIFYILFLGIYSYVLLVELKPQTSYLEWLLFVWVIGIFTEEIHQIIVRDLMITARYLPLMKKFHNYIHNVWNIIDVITIILFITGFILRILKLDDAARVILCLNLISFYIRFLHTLSIHKELGTKLIMIKKMMRDIGYFAIILLIFMTAYGIASQSILNPSTPASFELFKSVFRKAYFHLYAELFLEEYEENLDCKMNNNKCPSEVGTYIAITLMCIYVLLVNIVLLNLLIAMFSSTYEEVQKSSNLYWSFQKYELISEFYIRPTLPPPFILLSNIYQFCCYLFRKARRQDPIRKHIFSKTFNRCERKQLLDWEHQMVQSYVSTQNKPDNIKILIDQLTLKVEESQHNVEEKVSELSSRTDQLTSKVEESQHNVEEKVCELSSQTNQLTSKMKNVDKIDTILALLKEMHEKK